MPKPSLTIVVGKHMKEKGDSGDSEESEDSSEYEALGSELLSAIESKDGAAVYHAIDAIVQECLNHSEE